MQYTEQRSERLRGLSASTPKFSSMPWFGFRGLLSLWSGRGKSHEIGRDRSINEQPILLSRFLSLSFPLHLALLAPTATATHTCSSPLKRTIPTGDSETERIVVLYGYERIFNQSRVLWYWEYLDRGCPFEEAHLSLWDRLPFLENRLELRVNNIWRSMWWEALRE